MEFIKAILLACGSAVGTGLFTLLLSNLTYKREQKRNQEMRDEQILQKLEEIETKLNEHVAADERDKVEAGRTRFLRFCDECRRGVFHTEEHWNDILKDIDLEKSLGSEVMKRLQYRVDKETVNVNMLLYMNIL